MSDLFYGMVVGSACNLLAFFVFGRVMRSRERAAAKALAAKREVAMDMLRAIGRSNATTAQGVADVLVSVVNGVQP